MKTSHYDVAPAVQKSLQVILRKPHISENLFYALTPIEMEDLCSLVEIHVQTTEDPGFTLDVSELSTSGVCVKALSEYINTKMRAHETCV